MKEMLAEALQQVMEVKDNHGVLLNEVAIAAKSLILPAMAGALPIANNF